MLKPLCSIALALAATALAEKIDVPREGASVPMGSFGGRPLVEVRINGKGPFRFIVDTGAARSTVDDALKTELGLPPGGSATVKIDEFSVGDASLRNLEAMTIPYGQFFQDANPPRGVLSASAFPGYLVAFDFPGKRLTIRKGEMPAADGRRIFQYKEDQILPSVPVRVAGTDVDVHVDTGSPMGVVLPEKYLEVVPLLAPAVKKGTARTHGGQFAIWEADVKGNVELGEFKLASPQVRFSDVKPGPGPPSGNIGFEVLKDFTVTLDSKNRRVRFER